MTRKEAMCFSKKRYNTQIMAQGVARKRLQEGAPPLREYRCPHCLQWHLTKQTEQA